MHYYLTGYVGTGRTTPRDDSFRPRGTDGMGSWASIDLRGDPTSVAGRCVVAVESRDDAAIGGRYLGDDPRAPSAATRQGLASDLGLDLDADRLDQALLELLVEHATPDDDRSRWNALRPTRRGRLVVWLGSKLVDLAVPRGGATFTESFNTADSDTLGPDLTWTELAGDLDVAGNAAQRGSSDGTARAEHDLAGSNNYAKADIISTSWSAGRVGSVRCRFQGAADTSYMGVINGGNSSLLIWRRVTGSATTIATQSITEATGTTLLYVEADGSSIAAEASGAIAGTVSVTDTDITTGLRGGIYIGGTSGDIKVDNFEMGDLAGGTTHNESYAGASTPTGALVRQSNKALAGSSTPTGSLARQAAKTLTGASTPAGILVREVKQSLAGSTTPTGTLATTLTRLLALVGSTAPTGALVRLATKPLAGATTPTSTLARLVAKSLTGATTPTGALAKLAAKLFTGAVTAAGTLANDLIGRDANPVTLTIRDSGHTATIDDRGHQVTIRDSGHTATARERR